MRVLGDGRYSVAEVPVLNPVNTCDVKHTPKHRRADGTTAQQSRRVQYTHTLHVEKYITAVLTVIELRATEPAEDTHRPLHAGPCFLFIEEKIFKRDITRRSFRWCKHSHTTRNTTGRRCWLVFLGVSLLVVVMI